MQSKNNKNRDREKKRQREREKEKKEQETEIGKQRGETCSLETMNIETEIKEY